MAERDVCRGLPAEVRLKAVTTDGRLPFVFEASGSETHFTNGYDPNPRARRVFAFPQPATLARTLRDAAADPERPTWRGKVAAMPELDIKMLRPAQITAIGGIERSLAEQHFDRSLVQMATGAGKTFAAVTTAYRLLKHGGFNRVLFLVDRNNLADQTLAEFQNYRTPDDGRRFTEIYNVDKLTGAGMLGSSKVVVSTIQRVFKALSGDQVPDQDDPNLDDFVPDAPVTVVLQQGLPAGDVRPGHRRRGPPLHLRRVARRAGLLRRPHRRPDRHPRASRPSASSGRTWCPSTPTRSPWPTASTSTSTCTGSRPRSATRVRPSRLAPSSPPSTGAPASNASKPLTRHWNTPTRSSTGR